VLKLTGVDDAEDCGEAMNLPRSDGSQTRGAVRPTSRWLHGLRAPGLIALLVSMTSVGCWRGVGFPLALATTALVTAAIVSTVEPPPPRVVYVPQPRPGYAWQPGYWTRQNGDWVWVEGQWIALQPGYAWAPTHWEQLPDGTWQLVPGHWVGAPY
jgi:hypothetical protein